MSYAKQAAWDYDEKVVFRTIGEALREFLPVDKWQDFDTAERQRRVEKASSYVHDALGVKRPAPIIWTDDPGNEGAGYDECSEDGEIHYPAHHLEDVDPEHLVRGLCEEMRHAWQDDVRRDLTPHPLGEVGKRALERGFATYDENNTLNDSKNALELDG